MRTTIASILLTSVFGLAQPSVAAVNYYDSAAAFNAVATTTLIEDFSGITPKDTQLPSFTAGIVTYTPFAPLASPNLWVTGTSYSNFGTNLSPVTEHVLTTNGDEDILVEFAIAQSALSFNGYLNGLGPTTVQVFSGSTSLDTFNLGDPPGGAVYFIGLTSDTPMTGFRWTSTLGGVRNTALDNIAVSSVPEASSMAMLLAGIGFIGCLLRSRRIKLTA